MKIVPEKLISFVRSKGTLQLRTLKLKRRFTVSATESGLVFVPSTNKPRVHEMKWLSRVCTQFNKTESFRPSNYAHFTVNASYTLALIDKYLKAS